MKLSIKTIYHYTSERRIQFFKKGKRFYFSKEAIMTWVKEGEIKTMDEIEQEAINYLAKKI